jgi:hypothetical protein
MFLVLILIFIVLDLARPAMRIDLRNTGTSYDRAVLEYQYFSLLKSVKFDTISRVLPVPGNTRIVNVEERLTLL